MIKENLHAYLTDIPDYLWGMRHTSDLTYAEWGYRITVFPAAKMGSSSRARLRATGQCRPLISARPAVSGATFPITLLPGERSTHYFRFWKRMDLGGHSYRICREFVRLLAGRKSPRQRGDHRQSECPKHGMQRRAKLRRGQENQRVASATSWSIRSASAVAMVLPANLQRSRRSRQSLASLLYPVSSPPRQTYLGRWRLCGDTARAGRETVALYPGIVKRTNSTLSKVASTMGCGTHLWLVGRTANSIAITNDKPRLARLRSSGDDSAMVACLGRLLIVFKQARRHARGEIALFPGFSVALGWSDSVLR